MRKVYCGLAGLMLLAVVAQFYFAAVGAFAKPQSDSSFALHDLTGMMIIPVLSLLATVAAAIARVPGKLIGLTILPLGLLVLQMLIIGVGSALSNSDAGDATTPAALAVLGLHALNGLAIMGVSGAVFTRAMTLVTGRRRGPSVRGGAAGETPERTPTPTRPQAGSRAEASGA